MYKTNINPRYVRIQVTPVNTGTARIEMVACNDATFSMEVASPRKISGLISKIAFAILIAFIFNVIFINALFFPDCNRETRDCFLIEKMWGQP